MSFKSKFTKEAEAKIKQEKKAVKTTTSTKKTIVLTVLTTLVAVTSLGSMFVLGINYERGINDRVKSEAKTLLVQVPVSKQ